MIRKYTILLSVFALFSVAGLQAQAFHYDTVPNPNKTTTQQKLTAVQSTVSKEQKPSSGFDKNKLFLGGTFGLTFGDYTSLSIAPQIGYQVNKYFAWGGGIGYSYYRWKETSMYDKVSYNYLGLNAFARATPFQALILQVQPELYGLWGSQVDSQMVPCLLAGGGISVPAGRGAMTAMVYYDLLQQDYSPYRDQVVYSVGYAFSF